jgi:hypothetical protein
MSDIFRTVDRRLFIATGSHDDAAIDPAKS